MFAIDGTSGKLLWSKPTPDFEVYKYEDALTGVKDNTVLAWGFGFQETCGKDLNSFAFAKLHLDTAKAELIACIPKETVVHFKPDMAAFSHTNARLATASGNAFTGAMQLLVFDAATGKTVLSTDLKGLLLELPVSTDAPFAEVWGIAYLPPVPEA